ncbi:MAG: tetratricopeptide repeat protein, partial [Planctomycetota bacterium]
ELLDQLVDRTPEANEDRVILRVDQARLALARQLNEDALRYVDEALEIDKRRLDALLMKAMALEKLGRPQEAGDEYRALVSLAPQWPHGQVAYARYLSRVGRPEEGRESLRKIAETPHLGEQALLRKRVEAYQLLIRDLLAQDLEQQAFKDARACFELAPRDGDTVRLLARSAFLANQAGLVRVLIEKTAQDNPKDAAVLLAVGEAWQELRDADKALEVFRVVARLVPTSLEESMDVAMATIYTGRFAEAERMLRALQQDSPKHPHLYYLMGRLYERMGRRLQARDEYTKAIAADPSRNLYRIFCARILIDEGHYVLARSVLRQARGPDENVNKLLILINIREGGTVEEGTLAAEPGSGVERANHLLEIGQVEKALDYCRELLAPDPLKKDVDVLRVMARAYLLSDEKDRLDQAVKTLTEALKLEPQQQDLYNRLAAVRLDLVQQETPGNETNLARVEQALRAIEGIQPERIDLAMGALSAFRGDYERAAAYYRKVAEKSGVSIEFASNVRVLLAAALSAAKKPDEALAEIDKIKGSDAWEKQARLTKARVLLEAQRATQCIQTLDGLREDARTDKNAGLLLQVAQLFARMKEGRPNALAVCDELIVLEPNDATGYQFKALLLASEKRFDDAVAVYREAIRHQPGNFSTYHHLVRLLDSLQRREEALRVLDGLASMGKAGQAAALLQRGTLFAEWGLHGRATEMFSELLEMDKSYAETPRVLLGLGQSVARLGDVDKARTILGRIPRHASEYVGAQLLLATLAETDDAKLAVLDRLRKDRPDLRTDQAVIGLKLHTLFAAKRYG